MKAGARLLGFDTSVAPPAVAHGLGMETGAEVHSCQRLRTVSDAPVLLESFAIPADLFPGFESRDIEGRSVYEIMRTDYAVEVSTASQSLEARALGPLQAHLLRVDDGSPAILERRLTHGGSGRLVELSTYL